MIVWATGGFAVAADLLLVWICMPPLHARRRKVSAQIAGLLFGCCVALIPMVLLALAAQRVGATQSEFQRAVFAVLVPVVAFMLWMVLRLRRIEKAG